MRNLNERVTTHLTTRYGVESILFIRIYLAENDYYTYIEKPTPQLLGTGRIISISNLDTIIDASKNGSSASIDVTIDDTVGTFKDLIDRRNIHKLRCQVFQWFEGLPLSDAFVLFTGEINTPVIWDEASRNVTFSVVSILEELEVGFSIEEGGWQVVPAELIGKSWPIVFGTVAQSPCLQLNEMPSAFTADGFAILNKDQWDNEVNALLVSAREAELQAGIALNLGYAATLTASTFNDGFDGEFNSPSDNEASWQQYQNQANQYYSQVGQYLQTRNSLLAQANALSADYQSKRRYERDMIRVFSSNLPINALMVVEIGGIYFRARSSGLTLSLLEEVSLPATRPVYFNQIQDTARATTYSAVRAPEKIRWVDSGTKVNVVSYPLQYIATIGNGTILNVYGTYKGVRVVVPRQYYVITQPQFTNETNTMTVTMITMVTPLSTLGYDNDVISADITAHSSRFIDILGYVIENFTNLGVGPWPTLDIPPMNFVLENRPEALSLIKELCYQAKVACWIDQDYNLQLRYLPTQPEPVDSIELGDILENSLTITSTPTEDIYTKLSGQWRFSGADDFNLVVARNNVALYGLSKQDTNYFAFNNPDAVQWSLNYWSIIKSNCWKIVKFKTTLHKLKIETLDAITITIPQAANGSVVGIVQSAVYDIQAGEINMVVWLPVRFGEMDLYPFAYPAIDVIYTRPAVEKTSSNPWEDVSDRQPRPPFIARQYFNMTSYADNTKEPKLESYGTNDVTDWNVETWVQPIEQNDTKPDNLEEANDFQQTTIKPVTILEVDTAEANNVKIGMIKSGSGKEYKVELLDGSTLDAEQLLIDDDATIPEGTPVIVVKYDEVWYMQAPVWLLGTTGE